MGYWFPSTIWVKLGPYFKYLDLILKIETGTVCTNSYPHNHFSLHSDQYPISPDNNTAWSIIQVMRVNETDQQLFLDDFNKFSQAVPGEMYDAANAENIHVDWD